MTAAAPLERRRTGRLAYIEGLRGIAATVVALGHIAEVPPPKNPSGGFFDVDLQHKVVWPVLFNGQMVWLFLMVSGFALYYSEIDRRAHGRGATPVGVYARRRAWRILPTYYVAVAIGFIVVVVLAPIYLKPSGTVNTARPVTLGGFVSHLFLVQNFSLSWIHQINPPLWSLAIEAQWYLLFPLLLWRAWSRRGPWIPATVLFLFAVAVQWATALPIFGLSEFFLVGAVLAHVAVRYPLPRRTLSVIAVTMLTIGVLGPARTSGHRQEVIWLIGFAALILRLYRAPDGRRNLATWRPVMWLGKISYSIYAVHFPIVLLCWAAVGRIGASRPVHMAMLALVAVPLSLLAASLTYRFVEAPSLVRVRRAGTRPAPYEERLAA
jgi:peptidoglycan/LPS O-acetylase OafA/YrhL